MVDVIEQLKISLNTTKKNKPKQTKANQKQTKTNREEKPRKTFCELATQKISKMWTENEREMFAEYRQGGDKHHEHANKRPETKWQVNLWRQAMLLLMFSTNVFFLDGTM